MTLLVILTMSSMTIAQNDSQSNDLGGLTKLQAGVYLNQEMVDAIIQKYPELASVLKNSLHLPEGYHVPKQNMKDHMNDVAELKAEEKRKTAKIKALEEALNSERKQHDDETKALNDRIEFLELQRDYWKEVAMDNMDLSIKQKVGYTSTGTVIGVAVGLYAAAK